MLRLLLNFTLLLWFVVPTLAQPTIMISSPTVAESNDIVNLEVSVTNFSSITSMQFSLNWDPSVLKYLSTDNYGLDFLDVNNFGTEPADVDNGKMRFLWFDSSTNGITVDDNTIIFTIRCRAIGPMGSSTNIDITGDPTIIEVTQDGAEVTPTLQNGVMNIAANPNPTINIDNGKIVLHQNYPNPFTGQTDIFFEIKQSEQITLTINDVSGKVLYELTETFTDGKHSLQIKDDIFPTSGVYLYTLKIKNHILTNKLIVL